MKWGAFRQMVRGVVLQDDPADITKRRYSDAVLLAALNWSQRALCSHTALVKRVEYEKFTGTKLDIPVDMYEPITISGRVYTVRSDGSIQYLDPAQRTLGIPPGTKGNFFELVPRKTVYLATPDLSDPDNPVYTTDEPEHILVPKFDGRLGLEYFAFYPEPVDDDSDLYFPSWAEAAITYMIAANAMGAYTTRAAQIRQWAESPEKGDTEENVFKVTHAWFIKLWETELSRVPRQNRADFFRSTGR